MEFIVYWFCVTFVFSTFTIAAIDFRKVRRLAVIGLFCVTANGATVCISKADHGLASDLDYVYDSTVTSAPWHSMGLSMTPINADTMQQSRIIQDVTLEPIFRADGTVVSDYIAAVESGNVIGIHGSDYQAHQSRDFFEQSVLPSTQRHNLPIASAGRLFDGRRFFFSAAIPSGRFNLGSMGNSRAKDVGIEAWALWASSHDGTLASMLALVMICVVCANTLAIAVGQAGAKNSMRQRHRSVLDPDKFNGWLDSALVSVESYKAEAEKLRQAERFKLEAELFVAELIQPALLDRVISETAMAKGTDYRAAVEACLQADAKAKAFQAALADDANPTVTKILTESLPYQAGGDDGSMWSAYNAISYWTDHERGRTNGARLNNALFGPSSDLKTKAHQLAVVYSDSYHQTMHRYDVQGSPETPSSNDPPSLLDSIIDS